MNATLRLQGQIEEKTQSEILDSIKGVDYDYFYTGRRQGTSKVIIEIHITSVITDWAENIYTRKSWYMGHRKDWKACIENHIKIHLLDLGTGQLLVKRMMRDFEATKEKFKDWEKYQPTHFRG